MTKFEATFFNPEYNRIDFDTAEAATAAVEEVGKGQVVKFYGQPNMPFCLPKIVYKSSTMWSLKEGKWFEHYIHDGYGNPVAESRPQ
jgi:hypothetical protein